MAWDGRYSQTANPQAPPALSQFAFLIGDWHCAARLKDGAGAWQSYRAAWRGRFILDGHAIADEYRMVDASGGLMVLGVNVRSYDAARRAWNIRWLDALTGRWTDLISPELGGVRMAGESVSYAFREPAGGHGFTRATYRPGPGRHFTWQGEKSEDAKSWTEFMVIECDRDGP